MSGTGQQDIETLARRLAEAEAELAELKETQLAAEELISELHLDLTRSALRTEESRSELDRLLHGLRLLNDARDSAQIFERLLQFLETRFCLG